MQRWLLLPTCLCVGLLLGGVPGVRPAEAQTGGEPAAAAAGWLAPERLSAIEVQRLLAEAAAAVEGRTVRIRDGDTTVPVDGPGRAVLFVIFSGTLPVEDLGLKDGPHGRLRGFRAAATPPRSEVGAKQTLWIDVATRLPQRFEFTYEVPGLGDLAYDLLFE